jgi:methylphosphotriester-DNA--protein-cysteine methyltransferase
MHKQQRNPSKGLETDCFPERVAQTTRRLEPHIQSQPNEAIGVSVIGQSGGTIEHLFEHSARLSPQEQFESRRIESAHPNLRISPAQTPAIAAAMTRM